jgi:hypothetical protein
MKTIYTILFLLLISFAGFAQKGKKLSKKESANLTQEQRMVRNADRKSKGGKKDLSMKKRVKIDQKQDKRARSVKGPKKRKAVKRPN